MGKKYFFCVVASVFSIFMGGSFSFAGSDLEWDKSASDEVTGYRIYYGTEQGNYPQKLEVGNATRCALSDLPLKDNTKYYFVVRAYNGTGESTDSNEVVWESGDTTPPLPPQSVTVK